jgi:hypothetical protein
VNVMVRRFAVVVIMGILCILPSHATDATIPSALIRALVEDVTITGRYNNGDSYSEYHAPDGRVLGHNRRRENSGSCWDIRDDTVCYYYPVKDKVPRACRQLSQMTAAMRCIAPRNVFASLS